MNTEYAYSLTTELYFVLYLLGLTLILYLFIRPLFHKKWPPFLVGLSYFSTLLFLDFITIEISNFTAYFSSSVLAFIVMLISEQGNRAAKFLYAFLFFAVRWLLPKFFEFAQKYSIEPWLLTTNTPISLAVVWSVKYLLLFSGFYLICKWLHESFSTIQINSKTAIILSVPACISVLSYLFVMELQLFKLSTKAEFILALFYIGLIGVILLFVGLYVKQEQVRATLAQEQLLNAQVQVTKQHFDQIETLYGELKGLKHDLTNHFEVIEQLMVNQHYDEAMHYTEKIREQATSLESFTTGHPVTDIVLQQKQERAAHFHLAVDSDFYFPKQLNIEPFDMSIVLNNLLDNAIEGSIHCPGEAIKIQCRRQHDLFLLSVSNSLASPISFDLVTGLPTSTKHSELHGIGLKNVQAIVKKYGGELLFHEESKVLKITALFVSSSNRS